MPADPQARGATGLVEPDAGSDVTSAQTTAEKDGDEYVINGSKMFISNATLADYIMVFCKTHPEAPRHRQYSLIMVETDRAGYQANKLKDKLGIRAADCAEVVFKDVRVPATNLIGKEQEEQHDYLYWEFFELGGKQAILKDNWKAVKLKVRGPAEGVTGGPHAGAVSAPGLQDRPGNPLTDA